MIKMIDVEPSEIKAIMEAYGFADIDIPNEFNPNLTKSVSEWLSSFVVWYAKGYAIDHFLSTSLKELPLLIRFLRTCEGSALEIKGIITKPQGKQKIGTELTISISNHRFLAWFELFVNSWLERMQDGLFQYEFDWDFKKPLEDEEGQDPFFTEPYSDEEISQIISYYEKLEKSHLKYSKNGELGRLAYRIIDLIQPVVADWNRTKLYSFAYDVMLLGKCTGKSCITEEGFSGDIGREKAQQVRNWLNARQRDIGKKK